MPFEKPQNIYMHQVEPEESSDFRLKNLDPEFSRHFDQNTALSEVKNLQAPFPIP